MAEEGEVAETGVGEVDVEVEEAVEVASEEEKL